ncbi:MED29 polymerase, partial [Mystacornis crossleyi]|nr:MED29 polymerase [Mystacornis crossleyi]
QAQDFDPVQRFRLLLPQLKESLQVGGARSGRGLPPKWVVACSKGAKSADGALQRFDKSLEEFYALCDQLELCLRLAHECLSQSFDSAKHAPALVPAAPKGEGGPGGETLPYTQYLPLIKAQIAGAKDIHNALLEGTNKITGKLPPPGGP